MGASVSHGVIPVRYGQLLVSARPAPFSAAGTCGARMNRLPKGKPMTSCEIMMIALENGRPERLSCQLHDRMRYWLANTPGPDAEPRAAYKWSGVDFAIYIISPTYTFDDKERSNWHVHRVDLGRDEDGNQRWEVTATTPKGTLRVAGITNEIASWRAKPLLETETDSVLWKTSVIRCTRASSSLEPMPNWRPGGAPGRSPRHYPWVGRVVHRHHGDRGIGGEALLGALTAFALLPTQRTINIQGDLQYGGCLPSTPR